MLTNECLCFLLLFFFFFLFFFFCFFVIRSFFTEGLKILFLNFRIRVQVEILNTYYFCMFAFNIYLYLTTVSHLFHNKCSNVLGLK